MTAMQLNRLIDILDRQEEVRNVEDSLRLE